MADSPSLFSSRTDFIVSGAAIFISLCTLIVLLYEAKLMREHQRAAVWPYVEIGMSFGNGGFAVRTYNQGIGPARIRSMVVRVDGEPVPTWYEMLEVLGVEVSSYTEDRTNGRVLPAQTELQSLAVRGDGITDSVINAYLDERRLTFELCYCSVYDDCWRLETEGLDETRREIDTCASRPNAEFER